MKVLLAPLEGCERCFLLGLLCAFDATVGTFQVCDKVFSLLTGLQAPLGGRQCGFSAGRIMCLCELQAALPKHHVSKSWRGFRHQQRSGPVPLIVSAHFTLHALMMA